MNKLIADIRREFKKVATKADKEGAERYFKHKVFYYGVKTPKLQKIFRALWPQIKELPQKTQIAVAEKLLASKYLEDKYFGISIINKIVKNLPPDFLNTVEKWIDNYAHEWATCDTICGKIVRFLLMQDSKNVKQVVKWKNAKSIWRQRAAAVGFVNLARHGEYNKEIITICSTIIKNQERFVQLGAGWVLRELSLADLDLVVNFITKNYQYFTREGLRYAIEKMKPSMRKKLMNMNK